MKQIKSILVRDYMARELVTFTPEMRVLDAVNILVKRRISGAPVVDEHGSLIGILSDIDCIKVALHAAYYKQAGGRVSEYMTPKPITIDADATIMDAAELILEKHLQRMPVVRRTYLVGQISRHDVLRAMDELQQ